MGLMFAIERYLARTGMKPSQFGRRAVGDPSFVREISNGRQPRPETVARVLEFMKQNPSDFTGTSRSL